MPHVLVTEIGGPGRWAQASVTFKFVHSFFGGAPQAVTQVRLLSLGNNGQILQTHNQQAIYKPASKNWAFELPGLVGVDYPTDGNRPIALFHKRVDGYSYEILMPADNSYEAISQLLDDLNKERGLRRAVTDVANIQNIWPHAAL